MNRKLWVKMTVISAIFMGVFDFWSTRGSQLLLQYLQQHKSLEEAAYWLGVATVIIPAVIIMLFAASLFYIALHSQDEEEDGE